MPGVATAGNAGQVVIAIPMMVVSRLASEVVGLTAAFFVEGR
jgi:hypothetical protein